MPKKKKTPKSSENISTPQMAYRTSAGEINMNSKGYNSNDKAVQPGKNDKIYCVGAGRDKGTKYLKLHDETGKLVLVPRYLRKLFSQRCSERLAEIVDNSD